MKPNRTVSTISFAVKARFFLLPVTSLALLTFSSISARSQTVVTFDDIPTPNTYASIPNGYEGLSWSSYFSCLNAVQFTAGGQYPSGYVYGMVSPSNVAYKGSASPVEIDSQGTNFNFLNVYLTGA